MVLPPTFTATSSSRNDSSIPSFLAMNSRQPQMPGAFPSDVPVPYRRPTDLKTQFSNESTDRFSSNSDSWDSEGDSSSVLSTSTNATTVASDITVGKDDGYATQLHSSSGTATPTQNRYGETESPPRLITRAPPAPQPILRHTGHKSGLSSSSKMSSSVTKPSSTPSHGSNKASSSGSASSSTRHGSGPSIHIEVHGPESRRNTESDARMRQKIEEVLMDKIEQLKSEQSNDIVPASASTSASAKQNLSVRFAEPEKRTARADKPSPLPAPTREDKRSQELVLQSREIHKLEQEIEKRDMLLRERERVDQERREQEERARLERERAEREKKQAEERERAEREKQRERDRQNLEIEKRAALKAQKAEQEEREKEKDRQRVEREKKEAEKAQKAQDKERSRERQQAEKEKKMQEKAQKEHEKLQASFIDQGKLLQDLKARFDEQSKVLEATDAERNELRHIKDEFEKKCDNLSKSLSHVSDKERYVVEQVASLQIIRDTLQKRVGPMEERETKYKADIAQLHSERDGLMRDTKAFLLRITDLEKEIKGLVEEKRGFITQVGELQKEKSDLKEQVKKLQGEATALEANIEARAKDYSEHIATIRTEHSAQIQGLESQISKLKDEHKTELEAKTAGLTKDHQARVDDLHVQIADLNVHIDGAHEHVERLDKEVKTLETSLADEKSKFGTLTAERDALSTDLEGHKLLAVSQETNILNLREDIARRSDVIAKLQETNKTLQAEQERAKEAAPKVEVVQPAPESKDAAPKIDELAAAKTALETKNSELEREATTAKTDFEARITQLEAERDAAAASLAAEKTQKAELEATAAKVPALEEEAAKVPVLQGEKTQLEAKVAELEAKTVDLEAQAAQVPSLREQLAAANKLIEGLTAAQQAGLNINAAVANNGTTTTDVPVMTPLSPTFPESPRLAPSHKSRSRAPSVVRSISSRSTSSRKSGGVKDDIALVLVRNPGDRGNVQVVRKCDLRAPRSRSQPPDQE